MAIGSGSNIRVELVALWGVLTLCKSLDLQVIHVAGDSKVVIDWFNGISALNVITLNQWKERVKELGSFFSQIQVFHIHRSFNSQAYILSKKGLESIYGTLFVDEYVGDIKMNIWSYSIF